MDGVFGRGGGSEVSECGGFARDLRLVVRIRYQLTSSIVVCMIDWLCSRKSEVISVVCKDMERANDASKIPSATFLIPDRRTHHEREKSREIP